MFASIKYRAITMSRLAIPESTDNCARRAVQRRRMSAFGKLFRVQERRGWVAGRHSPLRESDRMGGKRCGDDGADFGWRNAMVWGLRNVYLR
jgi:hypothetical protein